MAGAQCALFSAAICVLDVGDEVIVPEPAYVTYEAVVGASGAHTVLCRFAPNGNSSSIPRSGASHHAQDPSDNGQLAA